MKRDRSLLVYSATDIARHLACRHATDLDLRVAVGKLEREHRHDPMLDLLIELGIAHEKAYLGSLRESGKQVVEIAVTGTSSDVEETLDAMRRGIDVIAQASLANGKWMGRADVLLKTNTPSNFGNWSYEAVDTKLTQTTRGSAVLQLCLYTELLAAAQGVLPARMMVVKPGAPFSIDVLKTADFLAFYRRIKERFESQVAKGPDDTSYPQPNEYCDVCNWWSTCERRLRDDDHLSFVAGISKKQISELEEFGVRTLEGFAKAESPLRFAPKRGSLESLAKKKKQAEVQFAGRVNKRPTFLFNAPENLGGLNGLPAPNPGDIFFDIEGHQRVTGEGLEYLFGYVTCEGQDRQYHRIWALSKTEEKRLFERFIDFVMERWTRYPDLYIYHFAPYEPTALKRLATRHATRENELDQLLRAKRFIDLYSIVRQAITASVESYSIKKLEQFYEFERSQPLETAGKFLRQMERLIELELTTMVTPELREVIEAYNQDDVLSTVALRAWLERLRDFRLAEGYELTRPEFQDETPSEKHQQRIESTQQGFDRLVAGIDGEPKGECQKSRWLLAHMLDYFRREEKSNWWEYFRLHALDHDELIQERKAIAGLQFVASFEGTGHDRLPTDRYDFPHQEVTFEVDNQLVEVGGEKVGSVVAIDLEKSTIDIKKRKDSIAIHPNAVFSYEHVSPGSMPESLLDFGGILIRGDGRSARYDLLTQSAPRLRSLSLPLEGDVKDLAIKLAFDLDNSILPIQGPPGAGKTFIGSQMIIALAREGKRIGVTAVSHKVILNLLEGVFRHSQDGQPVQVAHHASSSGVDAPECVMLTKDKDRSLKVLREGGVLGGTAWLWSAPEFADQLDYLFIDEAGQMSLAMAIAAGRAAKNIVLLGDPQQLEQPQKGVHPTGTEVSALQHLLDGAETIPDGKGLFLDKTWRLHPSICKYTSQVFYEGKLESQQGLEQQKVLGDSEFTGSGLRYIPVDHKNNANRSDEEVLKIARIFETLTNGRHHWTKSDNSSVVITSADILIVAPYNAQVSCLKGKLPANARIGTVDKFQGQEAAVVIYSMTSSSAADAPRGMEFLFSRNRMNVATSRARCLVLLVGSPELLAPDCAKPDQMRMANGFCQYIEMASPLTESNLGNLQSR